MNTLLLLLTLNSVPHGWIRVQGIQTNNLFAQPEGSPAWGMALDWNVTWDLQPRLSLFAIGSGMSYLPGDSTLLGFTSGFGVEYQGWTWTLGARVAPTFYTGSFSDAQNWDLSGWSTWRTPLGSLQLQARHRVYLELSAYEFWEFEISGSHLRRRGPWSSIVSPILGFRAYPASSATAPSFPPHGGHFLPHEPTASSARQILRLGIQWTETWHPDPWTQIALALTYSRVFGDTLWTGFTAGALGDLELFDSPYGRNTLGLELTGTWDLPWRSQVRLATDILIKTYPWVVVEEGTSSEPASLRQDRQMALMLAWERGLVGSSTVEMDIRLLQNVSNDPNWTYQEVRFGVGVRAFF